MAESSSASERSRSPSPARAVTGVKLSRTFVWLRERPKAIPRGKPWDQLNRDGRVKDIEFSKKFTERQMRNLVRQNFSELKEADFTRIRLYKSGSRGSVLSKVAKNIPDASTLLHRFSGGSSKRVYILLKSDNKDGGDPTSRADPSATVPTSPNTLAPVPANAGVPPTLPLPRDGFSTRQYLTSLAQSRTDDGARTPTSPLSTGHSSVNSVIQLTVEDDADLQQSPFDNSVVLLDPIQILQENNSSATRAAVRTKSSSITRSPSTAATCRATERTKSSTKTTSPSTAGVFGTPFYSEGTKVGTVSGDMSPHGLGEESNLPSRTNEVRRCEERLLASCRGENTSLPSFLVHSFDELCWQARELTMAICVVLLNPRRENTGVREGIVRALRWLSAESQGKGMLYWPGETSSADGRTVCNISGVRYTSDAILVIVPSSSSVWKPTLVDCFEDSSITATNIEDRLATALEKAKDMLKVLAIQRERLETFRRDRAEQEEDLLKAQEQDSNEKNEGEEKEKDKVEEKQKEEDNDIRGKRKSRVLEEVTEGPKTVKIVLRHCNGKMERCFKKGAFFQEVYDWAGADATLPLHFSIQRGRQVIRHRDTLKTPEVLDVYGRDEREIITLLGTKVSFRGNVPSDELSESELSTTLIDATQEEQREEEEEEEEEEKKEEEKKEEQRREEGKEEERREEERKEEEKKEQERKEEEKKEQEKKEEAKKEQERKEEERDQEKNEDSKKAQYSRNEQENKDEERKEEGKLQRKRKKDKRSNAERKRFKKNK